MKRALLALLVLVSTCYGKDLGVDVTEYTVGLVNYPIAARAKTVIIVLSTVASPSGNTIGLETSFGSGVYSTITTSDPAIVFEAPAGDTLSTINFRLVTGAVRVIRLQ